MHFYIGEVLTMWAQVSNMIRIMVTALQLPKRHSSRMKGAYLRTEAIDKLRSEVVV